MPFTRTFPILITGPTGVGKTAVALQMASLQPSRIISADSMQVYRRLDIGTAKPTLEERRTIRHYGIDAADPDHLFSVAEYAAIAAPAVQETLQAEEWPLIVGGTRLYLQALTGAFDEGSPPDPEYRAQLNQEADEKGTGSIHTRLALVDPAAGVRIHPNDRKRIMRALEVHRAIGRGISDLQEDSRAQAPRLKALQFALVRDREELYRTVEARTTRMIEAGWLEEVQDLLDAGYGTGLAMIKAHGYRELAAHIRGEMSLEDAIEAINKNVRHYVRYQLGWIRQMPDVTVPDADAPAAVLANRIWEAVLQPQVF